MGRGQDTEGIRTVGEVSQLESHVGFWLRFVSNHVSGRFRKLVEGAGVTVSEWVALRSLHGEGATSTDLVESLGLTKGAVSKVVERLAQKGLVERVQDPRDGRVQRLALTPAGRELVPRLAALADANDEHYFGVLAPESRLLLEQLLRELVRAHRLTQFPTE